MPNARAGTGRNATPAGETNRADENSDHASNSDDEMNIGVTPRPVMATAAARAPYRSPMLNGTKRPNRPSVFVTARPRAVGASSSGQNKKGGAPQRRMTMEEQRKQIKLSAHSTVPLRTYTSDAQSIPSSNSQRQQREQKGESAPVGLIKLGRGQGKGKLERSSVASTRELDNSDYVADPETTDENAPDSCIARRTRQPFPLGDVEAPHQAPRPSPDGVHVSSQSKPRRRSEFDQGNTGEGEQTTKSFPFPLGDAAALRSKQQFPLCSVEIPSRPAPSSSIAESEPSTQGESLPAAEDTPPRTRRPFPLGTPSKSTSSSGSKRPSPDSQASRASPSQRIKLSKQ